ncbi:MAG: EscU/YscU/HrcU family type III secretion system export apparatus switch protein, partial [Planctomycetota bacterium]
MPEKPAAERTEQPTRKKLEKARQKGQVPQSQELTSIVTLLALIMIVALMGPSLLKWFITQVRAGMSCETAAFTDSSSFWIFTKAKIVDSLLIVCPILAALFAGCILACTAISGLNFA